MRHVSKHVFPTFNHRLAMWQQFRQRDWTSTGAKNRSLINLPLMPRLMVPLPCYEQGHAHCTGLWHGAKKKKQQAHKHVIDKNWEHRWSQPRESLFLCKQKVKERRGIIIHFPRRRRSGSIICFKYRSLINKSWAHIHSIQDPHSLVTINHQNTMKRFCSVLNV